MLEDIYRMTEHELNNAKIKNIFQRTRRSKSKRRNRRRRKNEGKTKEEEANEKRKEKRPWKYNSCGFEINSI